MLIRNERPDDVLCISHIHSTAFKGHPTHAPGAEPVEHHIVERLRAAGALSQSLLAEVGGEAAGHVALSPAVVGKERSGWFLLGPLGVLPQFQGQGIGSALVHESLRRMRGLGAAGIVLVGDPGFYARLGFGTVQGLVYQGVPEQYVLAACFSGTAPCGAILAHEAFDVSASVEPARPAGSQGQGECLPPASAGEQGSACADRAPLASTATELAALGFDQWFGAQAAALGLDGCGVARISAVDRGSYRMRGAAGEVPAELSGRLAYQSGSPADLPCVGDWVAAHLYNEGTAAIIHQVFPRRTFLRRKTPGENIEFQMIAANIDTAFIVQSCHFDFNPSRLDRYLVMATDGHVEPVVLLTKTDLIPQEELDQKLAIISSVTKARVIALSSVSGSGFDALRQILSPGKTYCLLGSSGVGKTTLLNRLMGRETFATRAVSGTGEGTHTTTRRQLIVLRHGAMLVDTPGMRELGILGAGDGIDLEFEELVALSARCRYADCSHQHEPGCAVRAALESGELPEDRYASYAKLKKESEFHALSYLDKRKKDKAFGRFMKTAKKQIKD